MKHLRQCFRSYFWLTTAVCLAIHAVLATSAASRLTTTHDEYWHVPAGLLNLRTGGFHFDNLNPPLCRMAAALPLVFTSATTGPTDASHDAQGWGDVFLSANGPHYARWFLLGRVVIVLISVLGGLVTALWAREFFGERAGCLAALLWAFEPNLIAHGSLVTTDMGATAFFVFTLFRLWRFATRPAWTTALAWGLVLGLAQLAKFTCLLLYPLSMAAFLLIVLAGKNRFTLPTAARPEPKPAEAEPMRSPSPFVRIARPGGLFVFGLAVSLVVLNTGYLCRGSFSALRNYDFHSAAFKTAANRLQSIAWLPVPLPRDYLEGLDHQRQVMEQGHPVFLDGQWSVDGFPHYYLWALFYKLPHSLQILAFCSLLWLAVPAGVPRRALVQVLILFPAAVLLAVAEGSRMQLGVRYVLPAIPFLILFASQSAQWLDFKAFRLRAATLVILAGWMLFSVRYHPEHLAFFNELAGGPLGGREHLVDSNLDWGQDLDALKAYLDRNRAGEIGLAYFGTVPPAALGIHYHVPPGRVPQPGLYAVSVNFEQGRPHWVRTPRGEIRPVDIDEFAYFRFFDPVARIGASIDVFKLSAQDVARWHAAAREAGLGQ